MAHPRRRANNGVPILFRVGCWTFGFLLAGGLVGVHFMAGAPISAAFGPDASYDAFIRSVVRSIVLWVPIGTVLGLLAERMASAYHRVAVAVLAVVGVGIIAADVTMAWNAARDSESAQWRREQEELNRDRTPEMIASLEEARLDRPDDERIVRALGLLYFGIGEYERALPHLEHAAELSEGRGVVDARLMYHKAAALHLLERNGEAMEVLETYRSHCGDDLPLARQYELLLSLARPDD